MRRVAQVWFTSEFGATEAMWAFVVEGLPGTVAIDARGESLFEAVTRESEARLRAQLVQPAGGD